MAVTAALSTFFSLLSIICGAAALIHARLAVVDLENGLQPMQLDWQGESYTLEYNTRVNVQDWSALLDTSYAVLFCAAVLVALALVLNIAACLRAMKQ